MALPRLPLGPAPFAGYVLDPGFGQIGQASNTITATPSGTQANSIQLTSNINRVTVVAAAGDGVLLPIAQGGMYITVINTAANALNVWPSVGDAINALAPNAAFSVATLKTVTFCSAGTGQWNTLPYVP